MPEHLQLPERTFTDQEVREVLDGYAKKERELTRRLALALSAMGRMEPYFRAAIGPCPTCAGSPPAWPSVTLRRGGE